MSRHQITPGNTTDPELQNRGARANALAGSIPVRLRYQGLWLRHAPRSEDSRAFTGLKNRWGLPERKRPRGTCPDLAAVLCSSGPTGSYAAPRLRVKRHGRSDPGSSLLRSAAAYAHAAARLDGRGPRLYRTSTIPRRDRSPRPLPCSVRVTATTSAA